jgi:hypothetical protein
MAKWDGKYIVTEVTLSHVFEASCLDAKAY